MASDSKKVTLEVAVQTQQEQIDELEAKMRQLQQEKLEVTLETHSNALDEVNQEIEETRNRLDDLKGSVDVDNSEIEALESELESTQSLLEDLQGDVTVDDSEIEELEDYVNELESKLEELKASVTVDSSEIEELESKLEDLEATQLDLQINVAQDEVALAQAAMDDLRNSTDDAANSADNLNSALGMMDAMAIFQVGDALANYGGEAEQMAQDMNNAAISVGQLATQTGIAEPQMVSLINTISNATFPNEEAMMYVKSLSQIGVASENLGKSATDLDKINDAFHLGAERTNSLGQELSVLGVDMNNVSSSFNALAYANANTVGGMENYYTFLRKYDAQFKELGYSVDQSAVIIAAATHKYGGGRAALSGLSDALKEANGDSRKLEEALGLQAGALDNASALTGKYEGQLQNLANEEAEHKTWLDQIGAAWEDISLSLSPVLSPLSSFVGLIGQLGAYGMGLNGLWELGSKIRELSIVDSISGKFSGFRQTITNLGSSAKTAAASVGSSLVNALRTAGSAAKDAAIWLGKAAIEVLKGGLNAMKAAAMWLVEKAAKLGEIVVTKTAAAAQWLLNVAMSANPIMLVVIAITALIAILGYLYFNNEQVRAAVDGLGQALWGLGESIYGGLMGALDWLNGAWQNTVDFFTNGANTISESVTGAVQWLTDGLQWLSDTITGSLMDSVQWLSDGLQWLSDTITGSVMGAVQWLTDQFTWLGDIWNQVVNAFTTYAPLVGEVLFVMATGGVGAIILLIANFMGMPNQIGGALQNVITHVAGFVGDLVNRFTSGARQSVSNFMNQISSLPGKFVAELNRMLSAVNDWAATLPAKFWEAGVNAVKNFLNALGIHSPGYMQLALIGEMKNTTLGIVSEGKQLVSNLASIGYNAVKSWGNPELPYGYVNVNNMNTLSSSNVSNGNIEGLLNRIIELLAALSIVNNINYNHYGDIDSDEKMQEILEYIRKYLYYNNNTAGRTV